MDQSESGDVCSVCGENVSGSFEVSTGGATEAADFTITIARTADNDFNVCDACNKTVHFKCSKHPTTGYCDDCFDTYDLDDAGNAFPITAST